MHGHVCEQVGTAAAAIAAIDSFRPEIVILEWSFRDGSGRGLAAALRARSLTHGQPLLVIAFSSLDEPPEFRSSEQVDAYFTKPALASDIEKAFSVLEPT